MIPTLQCATLAKASIHSLFLTSSTWWRWARGPIQTPKFRNPAAQTNGTCRLRALFVILGSHGDKSSYGIQFESSFKGYKFTRDD